MKFIQISMIAVIVLIIVSCLPITSGQSANILIFTFDNSDENYKSKNCYQTAQEGALEVYDLLSEAQTYYDELYVNAELISKIIIQLKCNRGSNWFSISFNDKTIQSAERKILLTESLYTFNVSATGTVTKFTMHWNSENNYEDDRVIISSIVFQGSSSGGSSQSSQTPVKTMYPDDLVSVKNDRLYFSFEVATIVFVAILICCVGIVIYHYRPKERY